ncbi:MAG: hypothetical protein ACLRFI_00860 [Alphaproteobacteria bacterium]
MRKFSAFFVVIFGSLTICNADGAVVVKKASSVAKQEVEAMDSVASASSNLLPTALGLIDNLSKLKQQQKQLTEECVPTSTEISWMNDVIKKWAMTGQKTAEEAQGLMKLAPCVDGQTYSAQVQAMVEEPCFDTFNDKGMIWDAYPKASVATRTKDGTKVKQTLSNIYIVFEIMDFSDADLLPSEKTVYNSVVAKREKCSETKLTQRQRSLKKDFAMGVLSTVGQKQGTGDVLNAVGTFFDQGGGVGGLQGVALPTIMQIFDK